MAQGFSKKKKRVIAFLGVVWGGLLVAFLVFANSVAPPSGNTGGPGELTCAQAGCHTGTAVNGGPGNVTISAPTTYTSGTTYPIHVIVSDSTARRWGFELSARTQSGQQGGTLIAGSDGNSQLLSPINAIQYVGHTLQGTRGGVTGSVSFDFSWQAPDASAGPVIFYAAANGANNDFNTTGDHVYTTSVTVQPASGTTFSNTYYLTYLAIGVGYQTTITYVNYSPQTVTCETRFFTDSGGALSVPFSGGTVSTRTDTLAPGGSLHEETKADLNAAPQGGWAQVQCTGPIKASLLYRFYQQGQPAGEASVNAMAAPATKFVTYSDQSTGVAYANPSNQTAQVTFTALSATGGILATKTLPLQARELKTANVGALLGISNFKGSIQIVSTVPILSLSLNFEASPVFSSLPPGEVGDSIPTGAATYYLTYLAIGVGYQTTITYVNLSAQSVTCTTNFFSDSGGQLPVPFSGGTVSSRTDTLGPGGSLHEETTAGLNTPPAGGWARVQCSGPIKASLLYRFYQQGKPAGEASVNALAAPATKFVTYTDQSSGVAYTNPSTQSAQVTFTALSATGGLLASKTLTLSAGELKTANVGALLGLSSFKGSIQIISTVPILSLSLNFEASPVFSSLPPGDLEDSTPLATGTGGTVEPPPPDPGYGGYY